MKSIQGSAAHNYCYAEAIVMIGLAVTDLCLEVRRIRWDSALTDQHLGDSGQGADGPRDHH